MLFKNGLVYTDQHRFIQTDILIQNGKIAAVGNGLAPGQDEVLDLTGKRLLPGLCEIHSHGCGGADFCDGTPEAFRTLAATYIKHGITTVLGTSMTLPLERLSEIYRAYASFAADQGSDGARIAGIHMEGPFLSKEKRGAHCAEWIIPADIDAFQRLMADSQNRIRIVSVAPEVPGNLAFLADASASCTVSLAHSSADYATAMDAYDKGASSTTHLYNGMPPLLHRAPGIIGAALDHHAYLELICDGHHVLPPVVRATFRMAEPDRICCISDSISAAGMPEGSCQLGGVQVQVRDGLATLENGTIAGSISNLFDELKLLIEWGIPEELAIRSVTDNPAHAAGLTDVGSITPGKRADLLVVDSTYRLEAVYRDGVPQIIV